MEDESGYDAGSEATLASLESEISLSDYKRKKPCEICGSNANDNQLMTCFSCRRTREHLYCMRVLRDFAPALWICDECSSPPATANQTATSSTSTNQVLDNIDSIVQTANSNNQVVDKEVVHHNMTTSDSCDQISATHQPSHDAHTSPLVEEASSTVPMDTSLVKKQKLPDSNLPSDTESAN